jgi:beta-galactosidase
MDPFSPQLNRRKFVVAAIAVAALPAVSFGEVPFAPPASPRTRLDFNLDWRFHKEDLDGAEAPAFDDASWTPIATPHSFNDIDSFRTIIAHGGGDRGTYKGLAWYRKHFTPPPVPAGGKLFLEFEGMRQAGEIFLNGKQIGLYENGVTPYGVDITSAILPGKTNLLAVKLDNRTNYAERATGTTFQWNANDFNPDHGGINRRVWLHVTGPIYQTLPLFYGLETQGVYIHATNHDIAKRTAEITVDSEIRNALPDRATAELSAIVVDHEGNTVASLDGNTVDMVSGEKTVVSASGLLKSARFWSPDDPYLYDVFSIVKVEGKVVDVVKTTTGFRKAEFKGGAGTGGVHLNGRFLYLKGYAQRSTDEWAALGIAYPDWIHDYNAKLMRDTHANYVRWMHVAPTPVDADALCRAGIIQVCPGGDKEADTTGRRWEQRLEVMRDTIIYFRNNPSILFWEAGNTVITAEHMQQMVALRKQWDPEGQRVIGSRGNDNTEANLATTPIAEFYGVMIGQDPRTDALTSHDIFRGYSADRRDRAPLIETEDFRDEGARRFWDDDSPPYYGFKKGPNDTYQYTSESFTLAGVKRYWDYYTNRISNPDPAHSKWSGYASIYFSDSDADGRQDSSEVARVSGKVDAMRLPKQIYYAHRVIQNDHPDLHILGHWSYPPEKKVVKTIYVISNCDSVEVLLNGKSLGVQAKPTSGYIYAFESVAFAPGTIKAIGRVGTKSAAEYELTTAGPPAALKLTPILGPRGLVANGADAALIDVEVVDAQGRRCPTDDARVDFTLTGPAIWRGGYNSGKTDSTNNLYLNTELGINRVAIRTTTTRGAITLNATREGLKPARLVLTGI